MTWDPALDHPLNHHLDLSGCRPSEGVTVPAELNELPHIRRDLRRDGGAQPLDGDGVVELKHVHWTGPIFIRPGWAA